MSVYMGQNSSIVYFNLWIITQYKLQLNKDVKKQQLTKTDMEDKGVGEEKWWNYLVH